MSAWHSPRQAASATASNSACERSAKTLKRGLITKPDVLFLLGLCAVHHLEDKDALMQQTDDTGQDWIQICVPGMSPVEQSYNSLSIKPVDHARLHCPVRTQRLE